MKNPFVKKILRMLFSLAALTIICGFLARTLAGAQTLADYAAGKAEAAYDGTDAHIDEKIEENTGNETERDRVKKESSVTIPEQEETKIVQSTSDTMKTEDGTDHSIAGLQDGSDKIEIPDSRIVYQEGFYYEELSDSIKERITGISYPVMASEASELAVPAINTLAEHDVPAVSYDDLRFLSVLYYDFDGEVQSGELICNKGIVEDLAEIFYELYLNEYQIEKIKLIDEYQGDDTASMADNNTSCFNYRVVDGTASLSKHALGCAIDINPFYNPYVVFNRNGSGETYISPAGSEVYADRSKAFPYKIDENDLCYKLFKEHGFTWGGNWNSCKDYQHFQKLP